MRVILASSSPRRKEILNILGIEPDIIIPSVNERLKPGESIDDFVKRVSILKGKSIYRGEFYDSLVISSDTVVYIKNRIIGKPSSREDAFKILKILSNKSHDVLTGVALLYQGKTIYEISRTGVCFSKISDKEIEWYLDRENYMDKAGAYAIQKGAAAFVKMIDGCFFNVMGFPLNLFYNMIKQNNIDIFETS